MNSKNVTQIWAKVEALEVDSHGDCQGQYDRSQPCNLFGESLQDYNTLMTIVSRPPYGHDKSINGKIRLKAPISTSIIDSIIDLSIKGEVV